MSALIPVFNTNLEYLKENIESILSQTFSDFELLILNDSPQNLELEAFILDYAKKDSRIKYFKNPRNLGISPSRNKLIDLANGEFLAVIDHDDVSDKTRFEKQVRFLRENESVGVCGTQCSFAYNAKMMCKGEILPEPCKDNEIRLALMFGSAINHSSSMIKKKILLENNVYYQAIYTPCEDYKLWCDLIEFTEFANLSEVLHHRRAYDNTTAKSGKVMLERHAAISFYNKTKYPELFNVATIKSLDNTMKPKFNETNEINHTYQICVLGVPFFEFYKSNKTLKIKLFGKIELFKIKHKT